MKYFVKYLVVTFTLLICTNAIAEQKVVYMNMKTVLNTSSAGKKAQDSLQKNFITQQKKYSDMEKDLKKEEDSILAQKTLLEPSEYTKKINELRKKVIDYQANRRTSLDKISEQKQKARNTLIDNLDPILESYIKENNISIVLDQKNILIGSDALDITKIIIEKLNKKLPSLKLE